MGDINLQKIDKEDIINYIPDGTKEMPKELLKAAIDHADTIRDQKISVSKKSNNMKSEFLKS